MRFHRDEPFEDGNLPASDFVERFDRPDAPSSSSPAPRSADLELAPLNPDLGQYFGATDGVLVISPAGRQPRPQGRRRGPDGGRPEARRAPATCFGSCAATTRGESFKLDILRNRKRETVTARLGERDE